MFKNEIKLLLTGILRMISIVVIGGILLLAIFKRTSNGLINKSLGTVLFLALFLMILVSCSVLIFILYKRRKYRIYCTKNENELISYAMPKKELCKVDLYQKVYYAKFQMPVNSTKIETFMAVSNIPFLCNNCFIQSVDSLFVDGFNLSEIIILPLEFNEMVNPSWSEIQNNQRMNP